MAKARKDSRGRALRKGESERATDGRYVYSYTDPLGRRKWIYATNLTELREKEKQLIREQLDGLDTYAAGKATVNSTFDRYMSTKNNLRETSASNYTYMYDRYIRNTFGLKKIAEVKYSDVLRFYLYLLDEAGLSISTLDNIQCLLHPTFNLAVRDNIIRNNPTEGVVKEVAKRTDKTKGVRHALTMEQQRIFMDYVANHPIFYHWWPMFTILLGTGTRIGECLGLRWDDVDFERGVISINHSYAYYSDRSRKQMLKRMNRPKTDAGVRTIPMLDVVRDAFEIEKEQQLDMKGELNQQVIDGMTGFVFQNREGTVPSPHTVNQTIRRIVDSYNTEEFRNACNEKRDPVLMPYFSCHVLRHTFATRLCEVENNLKVIQSVMGHKTIETTMDIYAEATEEKKMESFGELSEKLSGLF